MPSELYLEHSRAGHTVDNCPLCKAIYDMALATGQSFGHVFYLVERLVDQPLAQPIRLELRDKTKADYPIVSTLPYEYVLRREQRNRD